MNGFFSQTKHSHADHSVYIFALCMFLSCIMDIFVSNWRMSFFLCVLTPRLQGGEPGVRSHYWVWFFWPGRVSVLAERDSHTHTHCDLTACDTLTFSHTSILVRVCRWLNAIPLTHSPETSITTDTRLNLSLTLTYNDSNISATRKCRPSNNHL